MEEKKEQGQEKKKEVAEGKVEEEKTVTQQVEEGNVEKREEVKAEEQDQDLPLKEDGTPDYQAGFLNKSKRYSDLRRISEDRESKNRELEQALDEAQQIQQNYQQQYNESINQQYVPPASLSKPDTTPAQVIEEIVDRSNIKRERIRNAKEQIEEISKANEDFAREFKIHFNDGESKEFVNRIVSAPRIVDDDGKTKYYNVQTGKYTKNYKEFLIGVFNVMKGGSVVKKEAPKQTSELAKQPSTMGSGSAKEVDDEVKLSPDEEAYMKAHFGEVKPETWKKMKKNLGY